MVSAPLSMPPSADLPATFSTGQAMRLGVSPRQLYAWRDAGEFIGLARGVFPAAATPQL